MKPYSFLLFASLSVTGIAVPTAISPSLERKNNDEQRGETAALNWGIVENGVKENCGCQPLTLIFARGTTEPGNMGLLAGPPLAKALRRLSRGKVTVQGVDYPASIVGNINFGEDGGPAMVDLINLSKSQCPDSKVVLAGYSQGASVIHNADGDLAKGQVARAVLYGDPLSDIPLRTIAEENVMSVCAEGDPVCRGGINFPAHLTYAQHADETATFLMGALG
ncbi:hypothetical protein AJ79_09890 [Helicocarpus griseus UAMH5409]|uniref:cutinase n=1 Tax=Helicocarpus griseus UAMH5409 TaxID=1447875 RepID=A0A2B7WGM8_9EURO|nr:hypothetical protein AJ79_09890 [Helicocarpus griseus UAMH5409]